MHADILSGAVCDSEDSVHGLWIDSQVISHTYIHDIVRFYIILFAATCNSVFIRTVSYSLTLGPLSCLFYTTPCILTHTLSRSRASSLFSLSVKVFDSDCENGSESGWTEADRKGVVFRAGQLQVEFSLYLLGTGHFAKSGSETTVSSSCGTDSMVENSSLALLSLPIELLEEIVLSPVLNLRDVCALRRVNWKLHYLVGRLWGRIAAVRCWLLWSRISIFYSVMYATTPPV